jgi:hypothetical protein
MCLRLRVHAPNLARVWEEPNLALHEIEIGLTARSCAELLCCAKVLSLCAAVSASCRQSCMRSNVGTLCDNDANAARASL